MTATIHPTACVAPGARLGDGVRVEAYALIEDDVVLGDGCVVGPHAVVLRHVRMGAGNRVHPHAVIGGLPQDLGFDAATETWVEIGERNVFREGFTVSRATRPGAATRIGSDGYFMNHSHVGHDCQVGDRVIFATGAAVGGHVEVGERVFLGGGAMVHQFCRIGPIAIVAGNSGVNKDILPYAMAQGAPARVFRLNLVGLRRAGVGAEGLRVLSEAYRCLRERRGLDHLPSTPELDQLRRWLESPSKRGVQPFLRRDREAQDAA